MQCKPEQLIPWIDQPRKQFNKSKHLELVDSIRRNGQLQNLIVRPHNGVFQVVCGERRRRALGALNLAAECTVRELDDKAAQQVALIENLERSDLHPLEEADALSGLGSTAENIAAITSQGTNWVRARLRLVRLVDQARTAFLDDDHPLDEDRALLICRLGPKDQKAMLVHCGEPLLKFKTLIRACKRVLSAGCFQTLLADSTMPGKACGVCHKRSNAQPTLFDDPMLQKDDLCLDGDCWRQNELEACERYSRDSPQPCQLISTVAEPDHDHALPRGEWKEKDQNPDSRGIAIDGPQIGELLGIAFHAEDAPVVPLPADLLKKIQNLDQLHPATVPQLLSTLLSMLSPQAAEHMRDAFNLDDPTSPEAVVAAMAAHLCPLVHPDGQLTQIAQDLLLSTPQFHNDLKVVATVPAGTNPKDDYGQLIVGADDPAVMKEWKKIRSGITRDTDSFLVDNGKGMVRWPR
ncbi:MAG: ParB/RepB/Spo0J family partition protein [Acidimicrobiales bacterium]|jgi:ParB/RepB/Spo0J family partition protein